MYTEYTVKNVKNHNILLYLFNFFFAPWTEPNEQKFFSRYCPLQKNDITVPFIVHFHMLVIHPFKFFD